MNKEYKWKLRKGSKKDICPACGKKTFVPYVSSSDGKTLAGAEYGRCERINHCGYIAYPNGVEKEIKPIEIEVKPTNKIRISQQLVDIMAKDITKNTLYQYAHGLIGDEAEQLFNLYRIGTSAQGGTIFWQIARSGAVHAGKIIFYADNGHRKKDVFPPVQWVHKLPGAKQYVIGDDLEQCFFGEHLTRNRKKPIAICESEKTAMLMTHYLPKYIWLASGGATNLKNKQNRSCLYGREVWLYPDNAQYHAWNMIAIEKGWNISDICEKQPTFEGCDILDIYENATN